MAQKKYSKHNGEAERARRSPKAFAAFVAILLVLAILAGACWYFLVYRKRGRNDAPGGGTAVVSGEVSVHFPELGNRYTGDCVYIKAGDTDILIDGGSRESSVDAIRTYVDGYCSDGILEYVIVTHADRDHIAAFAGNGTYESLFSFYECKTIIDFPRTDKTTQVYERYKRARDAEVAAGAAHYTALQCYRSEGGARQSYELSEHVTMTFLYNYFYEHSSSSENNYSVCMLLTQGTEHYLFTGDLEAKGEEYLVQYNDLPRCKLYKAGHHGSKTSSTDALLSVIRPETVCVCCCAGSDEYTDNGGNTFPTQDMIDRVARYTKNIYVTTLSDPSAPGGFVSMNGNIVFTSNGAESSVVGSNNSTVLKETPWFLKNRSWPEYGVR